MEHASSILPSGRQWKLVWNDEFDGTDLDLTKWDFRYHLLQQKHDTFIGPEGVELDGNSCLHLKLVRKGDQFYSTQLQTGYNYLDRPGEAVMSTGKKAHDFVWPVAPIKQAKFMHRYGYYEIRCRLQRQPGWWSAFWMQSPIIGASLDARQTGVEVDIMENFTRDNVISHNNHWGGYGTDHKHAGSGPRILEDTPDGFHLFGLEWTPDEYIYYVDGKESWRTSDVVSQIDEFLLVSTECTGYRNTDGPCEELKQATLPDDFVVDFVRVYDPV